MSTSFAISFEAATAADLPAIRELLVDAGLPVTDLTDATPVRFWLVRDQGRVVGTVALERHGNVAMLRSLAVRPDHRRTGLGRALIEHAERCARDEGIRALCLLTTTAVGLFDRHGYERIPRMDAPADVQRSEEFRSLCPDSAVCMLKRLS
jgi:amino-acid N-acetyltransferase